MRVFANADGGEIEHAAVLANFAPSEDGWVTVATLGDFPHKRGVQRVAEADIEAILANIATNGADWTGVPLYANPAHPADGDAPALAWAKQWRLANGALQCLPEWSAAGRARILENKEFKRVTVAWACRRCEDGQWHPFEIDHVGLTNRPNMRELPPIVNGPGGDQTDQTDQTDPTDPPELVELRNRSETAEGLLARVAASAGLAEDADPAALPAAIDTLCNRAARLELELAEARAESATERRIADEAIADRFIAMKKIDPAKRAVALRILANNREDALAVWSAAPVQTPGAAAPAGTKSPPADPLAGRVLVNSGLGRIERASDEDLAAIVAKARELQTSEQLGPEEANERAWALFANHAL